MAGWYTLFWILPAWLFHETVIGIAEGSSWFPWFCLYWHVSRGFLTLCFCRFSLQTRVTLFNFYFHRE